MGFTGKFGPDSLRIDAEKEVARIGEGIRRNNFV